jgi:putative alpha-1,2-mannosidase
MAREWFSRVAREGDGSTLVAGVGRRGSVERPEVDTYQRCGYLQLPTTSNHGSFPAASISLEWPVDDFAMSQFASEIGDSASAAGLQDRAQYWQNLFNPATHSISPRNALGFFPAGVDACGRRRAGVLACSKPNKSWGTADSSAPPSFGAASLAVTVNVSPPFMALQN